MIYICCRMLLFSSVKFNYLHLSLNFMCGRLHSAVISALFLQLWPMVNQLPSQNNFILYREDNFTTGTICGLSCKETRQMLSLQSKKFREPCIIKYSGPLIKVRLDTGMPIAHLCHIMAF